MVTLPVYDAKGSEVGKVDVDPDAIAPKINKQLLHRWRHQSSPSPRDQLIEKLTVNG